MLKYLKENNLSMCCGCRACEHICPQGAISMQLNDEGFIYPVLRHEKCTDCSLCERACPFATPVCQNEIKEAYAVQIKDKAKLLKSSSGGAFSLLADEIIRRGGYVVGCAWNENFEPVLTIAKTHDKIRAMQGSKYLFSDTNTVYVYVKALLNNNELVLFTGTPCQCAGLLSFLGKPYPNLYTADFLCHGVPSQKAFNCYLSYIEKKHKIQKGKHTENNTHHGIISYSFRDKTVRGWGLVTSYTWNKNNKIKKAVNVGKTDPYIYGFLNGYFNRYCCYSCPFRGPKRHTDFTFCDFWGIEKYHDFDASKGVSAITINSNKGLNLKKEIENGAYWQKTNLENIAENNSSLLSCENEKVPKIRKVIYPMLDKDGWKMVERKYLHDKNRIAKLVWYKLPRPFTSAIKKVLKALNK